MTNAKVKRRLEEAGYKERKKVEWTRQKALETINYVMDLNRKDLERIDDACQTEIDLYEIKLTEKRTTDGKSRFRRKSEINITTCKRDARNNRYNREVKETKKSKRNKHTPEYLKEQRY